MGVPRYRKMLLTNYDMNEITVRSMCYTRSQQWRCVNNPFPSALEGGKIELLWKLIF